MRIIAAKRPVVHCLAHDLGVGNSRKAHQFRKTAARLSRIALFHFLQGLVHREGAVIHRAVLDREAGV